MKKFGLKLFALTVMLAAVSPAYGQFNLKKAVSSATKAVQAFTLTDAQMAEYVKESVEWMDTHNPVLPEDNDYTKRLRRLTEGITDADGIPLNFKVYDVIDVNAFACPDGSVRVFSSLMDWKNRFDRKVEAKRLGYVMNNHIIKGGHLSAQPMGALHDYIAIDPVTEKPAVVNFPVCRDNPYKMDVEETKKLIDRYRPELIIFGKSMVLYKEPVAEIRKFVDEQGIKTTIMYDMAHVLGLIGDHFQKPFEEGAEIVTGSTHKTFFGPQRGVIGVNYKEEDLKYGLWKTIESRTFPGSVSNHHLGTLLGQLMAAYEMNAFKDEYQKAVIENAKSFAASLRAEGLDVAGDPAVGYTETHQVIVRVGYARGPEIAKRLEENNIICNYQATPEEEGFSASGALRMGVNEMTRFGFGKEDFARLAHLIADCVLHNANVKDEVAKLRAEHLEMKYCFSDKDTEELLNGFASATGI